MSLDHRLQRLEEGASPDDCPVCGVPSRKVIVQREWLPAVAEPPVGCTCPVDRVLVRRAAAPVRRRL